MPLIQLQAAPGTHRSRALRWVSLFSARPSISLTLALLATAWAYWPGLQGPLMLDDVGSLSPIIDWLEGRASTFDVLLGNVSGPTGRPLAMASFLLNAALGGDSVWALKLGNLVLHGVIGLLIWHLSRRIFCAVGILPACWPLLITAVWLLHPLQVSTVLYAVQRMTQLAALFSLLALFAWLKARELYERGPLTRARLWLWLAVPAFSLLALLSKENGALAPLLCVALDLALFGARAKRHREQRWMMQLILLAAGGAMAAVLLSGYGERLIAAYGIRDYSPLERVMTQMRVLWHYLGQILWPDVSSMGLYHDAFPPSRGWIQPVSTLIGLLAWLVVLALAWIVRARLPLFAAGLVLFLLGHALEASPLNLELYFEHRNYLPMFGALLAAVGLLQKLAVILRKRSWLAPVSMALLLPPLAWATAGQASIWSSSLRIAEQALRAHPDSIRAHVDLAIAAVEAGRPADAERVLERLAQHSRPEARKVGLLFQLGTACYHHRDADPAKLEQLRALADGRISLFQVSSFDMLASKFDEAPCGRLLAVDVAELALTHATAGAGPEPLFVSWRLRRTAARLLLGQGDHARVVDALAPVWSANIRDPESTFLYSTALANSGRTELALEVLDSAIAEMRTDPGGWRPVLIGLLRDIRTSQAR